MGEIQILLIVITLAIIFDFINGFHDTANAIATVVATRVLSPFFAIFMAASLNFLGALTGTAVAKTIGSGIVGATVPQEVVIAALASAIIWNLITWYFGIPSSSSHALIGGLVGGGIAASGIYIVDWYGLGFKVGLPLILSPIIGFSFCALFTKLLAKTVAGTNRKKANAHFQKLQLFSSAFMAYSHGSNDAQKTMGIITLALISSHQIPAEPFTVPLWVIVISATAMAVGTAGGGWKIIHTMGNKLTQLTPFHGFTAETSAASVIETASHFGFPLSTTHVIGSTIMGAGASNRIKSVRWNVAQRILQTWILTIPICIILGWICLHITSLLIIRH